MTTSIKINLTENIFNKNDVFNLNKIKDLKEIAGVSLLIKEKNTDINIYSQVAKYIYQKTLSRLFDYDIWFFFAFSIPSSKIVKYKLQKNIWLELYGIREKNKIKEFTKFIDEKDTLKVYHIINISSNEKLRNCLTKEIFSEKTYSKYIVLLPKKINLEKVLTIDWFTYSFFDSNLLKFVINNNGVIFREIGWFDDIEKGFIGIGNKNIIYKCCKQET